MIESGQQYIPTEMMQRSNGISHRTKEVLSVSKKAVQYELAFDRQKASELFALRETEKYEEEEKAFDGFIAMQLLTALGERFNRGLSEYSYQIRDNKLYGEHSDEPFENVLERGRAYREIHGNKLDHPREQAEVDGFQRIQEVLAHADTPEGAIMISISPPGKEGSIYKHNFYDGFQKMSDGSIRVIRFSSALTAEETVEKLQELDPFIEKPEDTSDVAVLAQPLLINTTYPLTLGALHQHLHKDHDIMSEDDFKKITDICNSLITSYIAVLKDEPVNERRQKILFNAILNRADQVAGSLKENTYEDRFSKKREWQYSQSDIIRLGSAPVRRVDTGCGLSGGYGVGSEAQGGMTALGIFSVSEFSTSGEQDQYGSLEFKCPAVICGKTNKRERGKLIEKCQHCSADVRC